MTETWLPLSLCRIDKPSLHPRGSLLALHYVSRKVPKVCWALRFDRNDGAKNIPYVYLIDGAPWNQPVAQIVRCSDADLDKQHVPGLSAPNAEIRIEVEAASWVRGSEVGYYEAGPFVSVGTFGFCLCGQNSARPEELHQWINCSNWMSDPASLQEAMNSNDAVATYSKRWRVVAEIPALGRALSIDFRPHEVRP